MVMGISLQVYSQAHQVSKKMPLPEPVAAPLVLPELDPASLGNFGDYTIFTYFLSPLAPVGLDYHRIAQKILKLERVCSQAFNSGSTSPSIGRSPWW